MLELIIAIGILSIVVVGAFQIMHEGLQLYRTNQNAADAQAAVLKVLTRLNLECVNAKSILVKEYPEGGAMIPGIVFASPMLDNGKVRLENGRLYWQKWICYYYIEADGKIFRAEEPLPAENSGGPGTTNLTAVEAALGSHTTNYFANSPSLSNRRLMASGISGFNITKYDGSQARSGGGLTTHDTYEILTKAGKPGRRVDGYYLEIQSRVTPRG